MRLGPGLVEGRFLTRLNRFAALVEVDGEQVMVHVANSGRMHELLVPGLRVLLKPQPGEHRKTQFDLALVDLGFTIASADARLPNTLVRSPTMAGRVSSSMTSDSMPEIRVSVRLAGSRGDFWAASSASNRTCSGPVPQQPPTTLSQPASTKRPKVPAIISGVSLYLPFSSGRPALGTQDTGNREREASVRM